MAEEHSHLCANCGTEIRHLDDWCNPAEYCSKNECREAEAKAEYERENIDEPLDAEDVDELLRGNIDSEVEYFRSRNERALRGINGAGLRN